MKERYLTSTRRVTLNLVPSLPARRLPDGRVALTQKFLEGVNELHRFWSDPLTVYFRDSQAAQGSLDEICVSPAELGFGVQVLNPAEITQAIVKENPGVVLLSLDDFHQSEMWTACRDNDVKCVYVSEYSLATRKQIIQETTPNPLKRLRRRHWEAGQEKRRLAAVVGANGLQCNGTPTDDCYRDLNANALLYFDSRITEDLLSSEEQVRNRLKGVESRPLQLFFSGRLTRMKGAMELLKVARQLRRLKVNFHLTICGDGDLKDEMQRAIETGHLQKHVSLMGVLDFRNDLVPYVRSAVDLFVCCHPQGDPSCTYLETMSCGVPIAGYANEAFEGVVRSSGSGWLTPLNNPAALARTIAEIQGTPDALREMSLSALRFARSHTFEQTFSRRIEHLRECMEPAADAAGA
jgi:glycosyltransferase involved in cell wall biosynthesis